MAGPRTDSTGQIQPRKRDDTPEVVTMLMRMKTEIARALPRHLTADRMLRIALTSLRTTRGLIECNQGSVLGSIMSAAQLGLEPNTPLGLCYLIPYKKQCQLIVGYQGYLELARRSGLVSMPQAVLVRQGDLFKVKYGLYPDVQHEPAEDDDRERRPWTHVYAFAHSLPKDSAPPIFVVLTRAQVMARKARSASANGSSSPWRTDEEAMVLKTAIRALWRWLPKTAEMATASAFDEHAERGTAQADTWSTDIVEAMKREGVVVDTPEPAVVADPETEPEPEAEATQEESSQ
jgi:recombination protein RecT